MTDREMLVELTVRDVNGREVVYAHKWTPFGPMFEPLFLTTGLTGEDGKALRAEVKITDLIGKAMERER